MTVMTCLVMSLLVVLNPVLSCIFLELQVDIIVWKISKIFCSLQKPWWSRAFLAHSVSCIIDCGFVSRRSYSSLIACPVMSVPVLSFLVMSLLDLFNPVLSCMVLALQFIIIVCKICKMFSFHASMILSSKL